MIEKNLANNNVKISVLAMLKPIVCANVWSHGDIKESFDYCQILANINEKSENSQKTYWSTTTREVAK